MRKIISLIAAAALCGAMLSGCVTQEAPFVPTGGQPAVSSSDSTVPTPPKPSPAEESLADAQAEILAQEAVIGVAYLGWCEGSFDQVTAYLADQSFYDGCLYLDLTDAEHFAANDGGELYAIIPADERVSVTVNEYSVMDPEGDYEPATGRELLSISDGKPIVLQGNISDIMPNLMVTADDGKGGTVQYNPSLSLEDGMLSMYFEGSAVICDLTPYESMGIYEGVIPEPDVELCNTWSARAENGSGELNDLMLTLEPDGFAEYVYAIGGVLTERFLGQWIMQDSVLTLDMYGGSALFLEADEAYDAEMTFEWEISGGNLVLTHIKGAPLISGTEGQSIVFEPAFAPVEWE